MNSKKIVIIGGVAAGASCAARLRRLDEKVEITILERGPYVSFANCGLPYRVGNVIKDDASLLLASPALFRNRFNISVHTGHEVLAIDREGQTVRVRRVSDDESVDFPYDSLVLTPGALPVVPPWEGVTLPGVFTVRSIPDIQAIRDWMEKVSVKNAVVVGGGFIGLEMAENLVHLGVHTTVVEMLDQVLPPLDADVVRPLEDHLRANGVQLALGSGVSGFVENPEGGIVVNTQDGKQYDADIVILSVGVRPDTALAKSAGLTLGERGGIKVDDQMRTSDPNIFAAGDAVEVSSILNGKPTLLALAGPANRQGRVIADVIGGLPSKFRGVQGTSVVGFFNMAAGGTGWTEKMLQREGRTGYAVQWLHPGHHVGYYPGAEPLHIKIVYEPDSGKFLGAQVTGKKDVARKIDVFAAFLQMGATVQDLAEAELAYSPQFGSAKDAVNLAGMMASNHVAGKISVVASPDGMPVNAQLVDVRDEDEFAAGHHPDAVNLPLGGLRQSLDQLDPARPVAVICQTGKRAYDGARMLTQNSFDVMNLSGGWSTWRHYF